MCEGPRRVLRSSIGLAEATAFLYNRNAVRLFRLLASEAKVPDSPVFKLERLYVGTLASSGERTSATPGVIARTPGVTPGHAAECVRAARLPVPPAADLSEAMPGAVGLFRGETVDFILAKAQRNDSGLGQVLYILLPAEALRALEGNVLALRPLGMTNMPSFSAVKDNLLPFELRDAAPLSADAQVEALYNLILTCQDSFAAIEGLLAALVQGQPLAITSAPPSLDLRLQFIQGLLSLLPVPARVGITFATTVQDAAATQAQLKFLARPAPPAGHLVFDWAAGRLLSDPPADSYSRYMVAQLRLDPSLVVEQTQDLSRTTVWRAMHKENLGRALAWVSRRAAIDQTVRDGQPADRATVASILREDPTLSDDLRLAYARHLLAFALALNDTASADVIPAVAVTSPTIAAAISEQLTAAIEAGQASAVTALLDRWLRRIPEASALRWHAILHQAAAAHLAGLLEQDDLGPAIRFLNEAQAAPPTLRFRQALPELLRLAQRPARTHTRLAEAVFLTAVEVLPAGDLYRLLGDSELVNQLPTPLQTALTYLQPVPRRDAPPHVLDHGARAFGEGHRMLILTRLVEWAMFLQRPELVDVGALQAVLVIAQSPQAAQFHNLIQHIVQEFSQISAIHVLDEPGPRVLVQLLLETHHYEDAIAMLEFYQYSVFGPARLADFARLAEELFRLTALPSEEITKALEHLEGSQVRPEPRAMIYCGALQNRQWAADQEYAAHRLTSMIFNDTSLITVVGQENALNLLQFHARPHNALDALRVGAALIEHTLAMGLEGTALVARMWPLITWDQDVTGVSLELLRRYIRGLPIQHVPGVITFLEREIGTDFAEALRAAYLMRLALEKADLVEFAGRVHTAAALFTDMATAYHTSKELPPIHRLRRELDTLTGGLSDPERGRLASNALAILQQAYELGQQDMLRQHNREHMAAQLLDNAIPPENGVDLLRFIGGILGDHQRLPLALEREAMAHLFGSRSAAIFLRETDAITRLLAGLLRAFEDEFACCVTAGAMVGELDSLWNTLSLYNQRRLRDQFAADCQHLADVLGVMAERATARVLANSNVGRQLEIGLRQPASALEARRWIHGYFARKHVRTHP